MFRLGILLIMHLMERYPCAEACYDVLDIDLVEHETQARAEMEWCVNHFKHYYDHREGDLFGYSCRQAQLDLEQPYLLRIKAEKLAMEPLLLHKVAQDHVDSRWCQETRSDILRRRFEEERAQQMATYDCMNAEDQINYGPLGVGPFREKQVDLNCWYGGWKQFYMAPGDPSD